MDGTKPRTVGAQPEERGVPKRKDARVPQDQIEGQREQGGNQNLPAQHQVSGQQEVCGERQEPDRDFGSMPAAMRQRDFHSGVDM